MASLFFGLLSVLPVLNVEDAIFFGGDIVAVSIRHQPPTLIASPSTDVGSPMNDKPSTLSFT